MGGCKCTGNSQERESAIGVQSVNKSPNLGGQYLDKSSRSILTLHFSSEIPKHVLHALLNVVSLIFSILSVVGFDLSLDSILCHWGKGISFHLTTRELLFELIYLFSEYINWLWEFLLGERIC